ncbi:MAG: phosphatidylcholine/phosphatidylserine synthase [Planctomycetota bacterium]
MLRFMNRANLLTLFGLSAALSGAILAINGKLHFGLVALVLSGLCDLFDGPLARTLDLDEEQRRFGARLDSLSDASCFGVATAVILHAAGLRSPAELLVVIAVALCAVWRLAYFDTVGLVQVEGQAPRFRGLPTTYAALLVPTAGLARLHSLEALRVAMNVTGILMAVAMVSPLPIPKPGRRSYPFLLLLAVGAIGLHVAIGMGRL